MPDGAFPFPPRLMREAVAAYYLGMSPTSFRAKVAPHVQAVRIDGIVGWVREDLDAWLDKHRGRPQPAPQETPQDERPARDLVTAALAGLAPPRRARRAPPQA